MHWISIRDFQQWRDLARAALSQGIQPAEVDYQEAGSQTALFADDAAWLLKDPGPKPPMVQRDFIALAETVGFHRHRSRWNLLYRLLWRLTHGEPSLLEITTDDDVLQVNKMEKEVRRDAHKMKAFVRFRKITREGQDYFVAWHRPDHRIVRKVAPFFARRFKAMKWTILTPDESVVWDEDQLQYGGGVPRSEAPGEDELEELWKVYYANIFNPARIKIKMMKSEMPVRHWPTLPEADIIADLLLAAPQRVEAMIQQHEGFAGTADNVIAASPSPPGSLAELQQLAQHCQACDLYRDATQVVFGSGPPDARLVLVGEQPGDQEDLAGHAFVGPAGKILDQALEAAGIVRAEIYITNIVKHFKHTVIQSKTGTRRLHQRPDAREIRCCRPWFEAEWKLLSQAKVLVCLGATAANAIIGPGFRIRSGRGTSVASPYCQMTIATWHPSAILRQADADAAAKLNAQLIGDLQTAAEQALA